MTVDPVAALAETLLTGSTRALARGLTWVEVGGQGRGSSP